jgi:pyruvate,water dikinase
VAFSRNPLTGLDEIVVEAVKGSGEALVQGGVTPERWVHKWGQWIAQPQESQIESTCLEQVAAGTRALARAYGQPIDLEWAYDGQNVQWLQLRPITSLRDTPIYSSHIAKEMVPGLIKPAVWSITVPMFSGLKHRVLTEIIGPNDLDAKELIKAFYYRAYFNMGALGDTFEALGLPRDAIEMMMGLEVEGAGKPSFKPGRRALRLLPRLTGFMHDKLRFARRVAAFRPRMEAAFAACDPDRLGEASEAEILESLEHLREVTAETEYYHVITQLLMFVYNGLLQSHLKRRGVDINTFSVTHGLHELETYDPAAHLAALHTQFRALDAGQQSSIRANGRAALEADGLQSLREAFDGFLARFGHLSDRTSDFSIASWGEQPDVILGMIADYPEAATERTSLSFEDAVPSPLWRLVLRPIYRRARLYRLYREEVGFHFALASNLFRRHLLLLGGRLAERGALAAPEDVFYLYLDEIHTLVAAATPGSTFVGLASQRQEEMAAYAAITPPTTLYGDEALPPIDAQGNVLRGVPTSQGYHSGPVCVVQGISDFGKVQPSDVLVIPYSEVGWTPLFAKAGAVVAEAGGMLSHSSIVAREYGIPAVVSVQGACNLVDGTWVTVDGYNGCVLIDDAGASAIGAPDIQE